MNFLFSNERKKMDEKIMINNTNNNKDWYVTYSVGEEKWSEKGMLKSIEHQEMHDQIELKGGGRQNVEDLCRHEACVNV